MIANGPILVTGATGFLGGRLVERLLEEGATVIGATRGERATPAPRFALETVDLEDGAAVGRLFRKWRFAEVYHLAAAGVRSDDNDAAPIVRMNTVPAIHLARAAIDGGVSRFIYMGTGYEYAGGAAPLDEWTPLGPLNLYGAAKAATSVLLDYYYRTAGLPLVTLRAFAAYGPGEKPPRLVPFVCRQAVQNAPVQLTAGTQVRDYLYAGDLIAGILAARQFAKPGSVYNLGSGVNQAVTVRDVVETILELARRPLSLCRFGAMAPRRVEPQYLVADYSRAERELGWRPKTRLREGLAMTLRWNAAQLAVCDREAAAVGTF